MFKGTGILSSFTYAITIINSSPPSSALPLRSYLRAEEHVVSLETLLPVEGDFGKYLTLKNESVNKLVSALKRSVQGQSLIA